MRVIYLGKDKPNVIKGLQYLIKNKFEIVAVNKLNNKEFIEISQKNHIPLMSDDLLYKKEFSGIDLIISYLYPKKISQPLLNLPKIGCINFHPAPLPDFRGVCGYSFGIFEEVKKWGVSAHFVDKNFDTGDIIEIMKFPIKPNTETAFSLEKKSQVILFELFKKIINLIRKGKKLTRNPQKNGRYFFKKDFEKIRKINFNDSYKIIDKKIRACWFPPIQGPL